MARKKKTYPVLENVTITDIAAEGKSLVRINDLVVFVPFCVPGDVVDLRIRRKKHSYAEAEVVRFVKYSDKRTEPVCQHFGLCGGCKWQNLPYEEQLAFKQKQVHDQLMRIGKVELPEFMPIKGSVKTFEYRNKLDFGCCNKQWLTKEELDAGVPFKPAIGFHITGAFDKILPVEKCWLMDNLHNEIRNSIYEYAVEQGLSFFDLRQQTGLLRDIIIRCSNSGEWMVIIQLHYDHTDESALAASKEQTEGLLAFVAEKFPQITSLMYLDNQKCNDTIGDQEIHVYKGRDYMYLLMEDLKFKVGPKSFYQTNTEQAYHLYSVVREFAFGTPLPSSGSKDDATDNDKANVNGNDGTNVNGNGNGDDEANSNAKTNGKPLVYDLYTGTGTIANFVARKAEKVIGIEYVPEAIEDAKVNSEVNGIENTDFYAGDMKDILTDDFIAGHGRPDIIITDPPRAGMHPDVVNVILNAHPQRIVYVSCNPATQARDLQLLDRDYKVMAVQPVDMFPHTPHVENVVMLEERR